jgi:hypothetical protein
VARSNAPTISPAPNVARGVTTLNRLVLERDAATTADSDANRVQTNVNLRQSSSHAAAGTALQTAGVLLTFIEAQPADVELSRYTHLPRIFT